MRIEWDRAEVRALFEDMVSVLVKRLYPEVQRVDGSGGDGGRDLQMWTEDGLVVYELKSFTGRLSQGGCKSQISRSLGRAADLEPVEWHLVAPIDLAPEERGWFDDLVAGKDFGCSWRGKTWLDSKMTKRPDIQRYFLEDGNQEVIDSLRELQADWDPSDAVSTASRMSDLRSRLNDHDPHYYYDLSLGSVEHPPKGNVVLSKTQGDTRVDIRPRYPTAVEDRPITVSISIQEGQGAAVADFQRALDRGDEVVLPMGTVNASIDAPGGLGGTFAGGGLRMSAVPQDIDDLLIEASVLDPDQRQVLARLEFTGETRTQGRTHVTVDASDPSGLVSAQLIAQKDSERLRANFSFKFKEVLPAVGIPPARWLEHLRAPNLLLLSINGDRFADPLELDDALVAEGPLMLFEKFHAVQEHVGIAFPVPTDITYDEFRAMDLAHQMLQPDGAAFEWVEISLQIHREGFNGLGEDLERYT